MLKIFSLRGPHRGPRPPGPQIWDPFPNGPPRRPGRVVADQGSTSRSPGVVKTLNLRSRFLYRRTQMPLKALISSRARIFWEDGPPRTLSALLVGGGGANTYEYMYIYSLILPLKRNFALKPILI